MSLKWNQRYYARLIIIIMLVFTLLLSIFSSVMFVAARSVMERQLGMNARGIAVATSHAIMDDVENYKQLIETGDMDSDYYKKTQRYFAEIVENSNLKFVYTEFRVDEDTIQFVLDSSATDSPDFLPLGTLGKNDFVREEAYQTQKPSYGPLIEYEGWGKIISAYAPIFDEDGNCIGLVGVDVDGVQLFEELNSIFFTMIATFGLMFIIILIILIRYLQDFLEPILKDKLTGAYNKRYFEKFLADAISQSQKNEIPLALMMLDIDHFKKVNDTYGHPFGDVMLQAVSQVIMGMLRKSDCFVRYGGEEFAVVLPATDIAAAEMVAERIRVAVEENVVFNAYTKTNVSLTISIGIASFQKGDSTAADFVKRADGALYSAKVTRNSVVTAPDAA